jgi:hypothetical protein
LGWGGVGRDRAPPRAWCSSQCTIRARPPPPPRVAPSAQTVRVQAVVKVMIAGAPAAGKGTQCAKIVEKVG